MYVNLRLPEANFVNDLLQLLADDNATSIIYVRLVIGYHLT